MEPVYLDYAATCPVDPRVIDAMLPYLTTHFGNPACRHRHGKVASDAVQVARRYVAATICARSEEITWTSGATESDNLALKGFQVKHIVTVATEHKAVLKTCECLTRQGRTVTVLPVERSGLVDLDRLWDAIGSKTGIVSVMAANNETGVLQDLQAIGQICQERGVLFHTDAAQAFGKVSIDVDRDNIDLLSISGHKIYGPKGVGALYVRRDLDMSIEPQMDGGGQEGGERSGTLNVPAIVGLGRAARIASAEMGGDAARTAELKYRLLDEIGALVPIQQNAPDVETLPGTLSLAFPGVKGKDLLRALDGRVSATAASACAAGCDKPSHVLEAMQLSRSVVMGTVRFTVGRFTTREDVDEAAGCVAEAFEEASRPSMALARPGLVDEDMVAAR